jgi:saposin
MKVLAIVFLVALAGGYCEQEEKKMPQFLHFDKCTLCEELLKIISLVGGNKEPAIEKAVDTICNYLGFFKQDCINLVHEYVPKLIGALGEGKTEEEACSYVGMCSSKKAVAKTVAKPVVKKETKGFGCSLCKALVSFIDGLLQNNEGDIEQKVNEYCNELPILQDQCKQIVDKYLDQIIQYLKDGQDQTYICNEIGGFCQEASYVAVQKAFVAHVKGQTKGVTCDICDEVCKWIIDFGVDKGIDEIEKFIDGKCDDLPFISGACKDLVNKWIGKLVDLLKQDLSPDEVCKKVGLC